MDASFATWIVVAVALAAANLPFANERVFGFISLKPAQAGGVRSKPFLARLLESRIGSVAVQTWEFHAVTGCLFLVLAFPGFVMRYLHKPRR